MARNRQHCSYSSSCRSDRRSHEIFGPESNDLVSYVNHAEDPSQMKLGIIGMERLAAEELQERREIDWRDYSEWLDRK